MLSRRLIRIRAMKSLYSYFINLKASSDILANETRLINKDDLYYELFKSIIRNEEIDDEKKNLNDYNKILDLANQFRQKQKNYEEEASKGLEIQKDLILKNYSFILYILLEWRKISEEIFIKMNKYNSASSGILDTDIYYNNKILRTIEASKYLNQIINNSQYNLVKLNNTIRSWYIEILRKDPKFIEYCSSKHINEFELIDYIIKKVILKSKIIKTHLNDIDPLWYLTKKIVINLINNTINQINIDKAGITVNTVITTEENSFFKNLIKGVIDKWDYLSNIFESKIENWNLNRLFYIDKILLVMGAYELLFYKTPPNICINEYLEISKIYSTPKSNKFINGVLDAFLKYLEDINKTNETKI